MPLATISKPRSTKGRAVLCARLAQDKQAHDLLVLDLSDLETSPAEFFVLASVNSDAQMKAVTDNIQRVMKELGFGSARVDGTAGSSWMVLDYFDVVVHVMNNEARAFYNLERLWGDAKAYGITPAGAARALASFPRRGGQP